MAKLSFAILCSFVLSSSMAFAKLGERHDRSMHQKSEPRPKEVVKWIGKTHCKHTSHTTNHSHRIEFINEETGEEFDVESAKLEDIHCKSGKNYRVEIEAEKSDGFLFWNGDLKVKSFKVLAELGDEEYTHKRPVSTISSRSNRR